jgi:hypothetical protein
MPFQSAGGVAVAAATKSDWTASKPSAFGPLAVLREHDVSARSGQCRRRNARPEADVCGVGDLSGSAYLNRAHGSAEVTVRELDAAKTVMLYGSLRSMATVRGTSGVRQNR